jgi:hypothetical protein
MVYDVMLPLPSWNVCGGTAETAVPFRIASKQAERPKRPTLQVVLGFTSEHITAEETPYCLAAGRAAGAFMPVPAIARGVMAG